MKKRKEIRILRLFESVFIMGGVLMLSLAFFHISLYSMVWDDYNLTMTMNDKIGWGDLKTDFNDYMNMFQDLGKTISFYTSMAVGLLTAGCSLCIMEIALPRNKKRKENVNGKRN